MTDNNHPITPPPELVERLQDLGTLDAIREAYRAGADWELGECVKWLSDRSSLTEKLRAARRPKPPSLKEQALEALDEMNAPPGSATANRFDIIRRALEKLDD